MFRLARIVPLNDAGALEAQPDDGKQGWLQVIYKGEHRWARPSYPFGRFTPPSKHWVRKYAGRLGAWVAPMAAPFGEELEDSLVYVGFAPLEGGTQADVVDEFPEKKLFFSERWELVVNDTAAEPSVTFRYVGDPENDANPPADPGAITVKFSQKPGDESIFVDHIVDGAPIGTNILVDKTGSVTVNVKKDVTTVVEEKTNTHVKDTATLEVDKKVTGVFHDDVELTVDKELKATVTKKVTLTLSDDLVADITKKVTATIGQELSATVASVSSLIMKADKAELQGASTSKLTLEAAKATLQGSGPTSTAELDASKFEVKVGAPGIKVEASKTTVGVGGMHASKYETFDAWATAVLNALNVAVSAMASHIHNATAPGAPTTPSTTWSAAWSAAWAGVTAADSAARSLIKSNGLEVPPT